MLSWQIGNVHRAEKNDHNGKRGIRETAKMRNFALWKLQWRQWGFWTESHLQTLNEKVT